jgi:DNA-binding NarL/FixJ family response regulator
VTIRVLLADDQPMVIAGLRTILDAEPDIDVVGVAHDGSTAVALAAELAPDLVLLDVRMPGMDGLTATREIIRAGGPRVVILTTFDLDEYVYTALQAGASGFIVKDIPDDQLVGGIRGVVRGDTLFAPTVTRRLVDAYTRRPPIAGTVPGAQTLTPREDEVWRLMAQGLSNAEIANYLVIGEATVKTHVSRVITKLGARDRIQAVVLAYENGML